MLCWNGYSEVNEFDNSNFSVLRQEIGLAGKNVFCVCWDVKTELNHSVIKAGFGEMKFSPKR